MFVTMPETLAATHLRQCERYLKESDNDQIGLLYAAQFAHMALHTALVAVRYSEIGIKIFRREERTPYLEEGIQTKPFKSLVDGIQIDDDKNKAISLLSDGRDRLQHPIPGPTGYTICELISGIEASVKIGTDLWSHPCFKASPDEPTRDQALSASDAILALCLNLRSKWACY